MLSRGYDNQTCSIARALEIVGERWTLLILRDAQLGIRRFDEFQADLGIATNVLTARLATLVDNGLMERVPYQERPVRYEYRLTAKGRELIIPIVALMQWGDRHFAGPEGPPRVARHPDCGGDLRAGLTCERCQATVDEDVSIVPGPGLLATPNNCRTDDDTPGKY